MTTLDSRALRNAFGSFMTGVAVVTTRNDDGTPVGFTANSFASVSLDPPLLLVCPGKFLSSFDTFATCTNFAVNIRSEGQEAVSNTFASFKGDRFAQVAHHSDLHGTPVLDHALARFSCTSRQVIPAGDHCILMGEVQDFAHAEGRGLGYAGGQYFSLGLERAALEQATGIATYGAIIEQRDRVLLDQTPEGFCPPQISRPDRGHMRQHLDDSLSARGIPVQLGAAYSVYDDALSHHAYFLATAAAAPLPGNTTAVAISDLPTLRYTTQPIADMMARFAIEARSRSFGLYLGDAQHGDVHTLPERT
jgi:flavin reductase (DIM6/NTAB) family NADH-FMN oxidoreductase RutF